MCDRCSKDECTGGFFHLVFTYWEFSVFYYCSKNIWHPSELLCISQSHQWPPLDLGSPLASEILNAWITKTLRREEWKPAGERGGKKQENHLDSLMGVMSICKCHWSFLRFVQHNFLGHLVQWSVWVGYTFEYKISFRGHDIKKIVLTDLGALDCCHQGSKGAAGVCWLTSMPETAHEKSNRRSSSVWQPWRFQQLRLIYLLPTLSVCGRPSWLEFGRIDPFPSLKFHQRVCRYRADVRE